jgi:hypothetical protein
MQSVAALGKLPVITTDMYSTVTGVTDVVVMCIVVVANEFVEIAVPSPVIEALENDGNVVVAGDEQ